MVPTARFDDLTPGREHAFELLGHVRTIEAHTIDEVVPALQEVEQAAHDGLWSAGYIAYEAAPAFDDALQVRSHRTGRPARGP